MATTKGDQIKEVKDPKAKRKKRKGQGSKQAEPKVNNPIEVFDLADLAADELADPATEAQDPEELQEAQDPQELADQEPKIEELADPEAPLVHYIDKEGERTLTAPLLIFKNGIYENKRVPLVDIPWGSEQWKYKGQWHYVVEYSHTEGQLVPARVDLMESTKKQDYISPSKLFRAIRWKEAQMLFAIDLQMWQKLNFGLMLALIVLLMVFLYLIYSSFSGPGA